MASEPTTPTPSSIPPPPSRITPTGNIATDIYQSVTNITDVPCARNSLLSGIASGAGIGVIRGLSAGPLTAGHWAMATFTIISLGSWHLCQKQMADERQKVVKIIESVPKRAVKQEDTQTTPSTSNNP
ncbi:hypothetical protein BD779DRAFT_1640687 [Infundibulicybe gibba]|nr:hypothetical protein BD779DRAFT_1640687 [Infundibulicybe gibba]